MAETLQEQGFRRTLDADRERYAKLEAKRWAEVDAMASPTAPVSVPVCPPAVMTGEPVEWDGVDPGPDPF